MSYGAAPSRENASNVAMTRQQLEAAFWATVEDCLMDFHGLTKAAAAEKVTDFWRRLRDISVPNTGERKEKPDQAFDDLIYHAEPWHLACNLAGKDTPLEPNRIAYEGILKRNHLI
jgi:hypothetical protein